MFQVLLRCSSGADGIDRLLSSSSSNPEETLGSTTCSLLEQDGPQQVLLAQADGGDGAVVELKRGPAVDHHAGVPAAGADADSEETEARESTSGGVTLKKVQCVIFGWIDEFCMGESVTCCP